VDTQFASLGIGRHFLSIGEAIFVVDLASGQITLVNPAAERLLGYSAEEARGLPLEALMPERLRPEVRRWRRRRLEMGLGPVALPAVRKDGAEIAVELSSTPIENDGRRYALLLLRDVTERAHQQARRDALLALARRCATETSSDRVLEVLLEEAVPLVGGDDGGIASWDEERGELRQARSFLPSQNIGALLSLRLSASGRAATRRTPVIVNDYQRQGDPSSPAGRAGTRAAIAVPLVHEGRLLGTLSVNTFKPGHRFTDEDAVALEQLAGIGASALVGLERARLEAALTVRNQVLAEVSHDMRTPVTAAMAQLELLRRELDRDDPRAERLQGGLARLESSVGRMAELIEQLDDVARLEAGRPLELLREPVDLLNLVRDSVILHAQIAGGHRIRLESVGPSVVGHWDATRLGRVVDNLLSNATKYSPVPGEVDVVVRREGDWALLSVRDRGVGIPATDLPKVFERFYRGRNVTHRVRGSGIGLAGARAIVEQHGGTIAVESREGEGSTFTVRLPVEGQASERTR
jgi:PAS domain S-box-containing protein